MSTFVSFTITCTNFPLHLFVSFVPTFRSEAKLITNIVLFLETECLNKLWGAIHQQHHLLEPKSTIDKL